MCFWLICGKNGFEISPLLPCTARGEILTAERSWPSFTCLGSLKVFPIVVLGRRCRECNIPLRDSFKSMISACIFTRFWCSWRSRCWRWPTSLRFSLAFLRVIPRLKSLVGYPLAYWDILYSFASSYLLYRLELYSQRQIKYGRRITPNYSKRNFCQLPKTWRIVSEHINYINYVQNDPAKIITCVTFCISSVSSSTSMIRHALSRIVAHCRGDFVDAVVWNTWNQSLTCFRLVKMFLKRCHGVCI